MIIEQITAVAVLGITWELLEIAHIIHTGYVTGHVSYKGASAAKKAIENYFIERGDQKNLSRKLEREAETVYDFEAAEAADKEAVKVLAEKYLTKLGTSVDNLRLAQSSFLRFSKVLKNLVETLTSNNNDKQFPDDLLELKTKFTDFEGTFTQFLLTAAPPPRQILYLADSLSETIVIDTYNAQLIQINKYMELLKGTGQAIASRFAQVFESIREALPETRENAPDFFEQLQQEIKQCMHSPRELILKKMKEILPQNETLAKNCTDIIEVFAAFQQGTKTRQTNLLEDNPGGVFSWPPKAKQKEVRQGIFRVATFQQSHETKQTNLLDNPAWRPLLVKSDQIAVGEHILRHAMEHSKQKLLITEIFLRNPISECSMEQISKRSMKEIEIDQLAYAMAGILRNWQIIKCEQIIHVLSTLKKNESFPENQDLDGLLEWLKTEERKKDPNALFKKLLVLPCYFSQCSARSALTKLKNLSHIEDPEKIIQQYLNSYYWRAIWEKNDTLIQLPESFKAKITQKDLIKMGKDDVFQIHNFVSIAMEKQVKVLIEDFQQLKTKLLDDQNNKNGYLVKHALYNKEQEEASKAQKDQEHNAGVVRIKKAESNIRCITTQASNLFPYLYKTKRINVEKWQVPTEDDLLQVIYIGVDPKRVCHYWSAIPNPLTHCLLPNKQDDSIVQAWFYAYRTCQVDMLPLFSNLSSAFEKGTSKKGSSEKDLPGSQEAIKNRLLLLIQAIFKDPKDPSKALSIAYNKVLNGLPSKALKEIETLFQDLKDYFVTASVRVYPELRKELPFIEQWWVCGRENLFKFGQEIAKERLETVQEIIGDLSVVLLAEDEKDLAQALGIFQVKYQDMHETMAKSGESSALYTILGNILNFLIPALRKQLTEDPEQTTSSLAEKKQLITPQPTVAKRLWVSLFRLPITSRVLSIPETIVDLFHAKTAEDQETRQNKITMKALCSLGTR